MTSDLDKAIQQLAQSDSAMEYAPHMRPYFDTIIEEIIKLKILAGIPLLYDNVEDYMKFYFGWENEE